MLRPVEFLSAERGDLIFSADVLHAVAHVRWSIQEPKTKRLGARAQLLESTMCRSSNSFRPSSLASLPQPASGRWGREDSGVDLSPSVVRSACPQGKEEASTRVPSELAAPRHFLKRRKTGNSFGLVEDGSRPVRW
ncbi:unnamed protein product [Prorocentrum cordatum]|uniref:Uncharacterized protein n=1 Tax=Prorocentrum cordatum TaxID=2364126 RepID=A0ABN9VXM5_9DINO|nr:unnamed protein product [Polarella glacialis]